MHAAMENTLLNEERQKAGFEVESMKVAFWGGKRSFEVSQRMAALAASDPVFKKDDRSSLSRVELIKSGLRKAAHVRKLALEHNLSDNEAFMLRLFVDERSYADLHWNMFVPALEGQATGKQQKKWLPLARKLRIIGCYAQTELGHGSNVKGLETTATFNISTDEFVLDSPTITATKWWPGGLGKVATHALVQARLIIHQKDYGVHAFVVQVRSLEDHMPLPGIEVGEIGMKYGNNTIDNGFLRFKHVPIPRKNMLMRMAKVTKEGKYMRTDVPPQILYGAMITAREIIISEAAINLSRAVTIAVRYSAVRRQFSAKEGLPEIQVLDYMTQQQRLFPLLASVYAFQFAAQWLKWLYEDVQVRFKQNDFSTLAEVHACTAALKALTTSVTAAGIEECRKLCGGHGYLCSSGLPDLYAAYLPSCTYEGDNTILFLEVGKFLINTYVRFQRGGQPQGSTTYISRLQTLIAQNCTALKGEDFLHRELLLCAFEVRAVRLLDQCAQRVLKFSDIQTGLHEFAEDVVAVARAHCQLVVISKFYEKLGEDIDGSGVSEQLQLIYCVYALSVMQECMGEFLLTGYLSPEQGVLVRSQLKALFSQIRPNAVALVDSFNHTDQFLGSALGSYDGDVYNRLYREAWKTPLNDREVADGYDDYIRPLIRHHQPTWIPSFAASKL